MLFFCELYVIRDELALLGRTAHHPRSWASTSYNYNRSWAALFRRAQTPANAERLCSNIWDGVTATRSTRRWLHRGRAFAVAPSSFALDIPHVAFSTGEGICQRKAESSVSFSGARAGVAWRRAAGGGRRRVAGD